DTGEAIAVDSSGDAFVTGITQSTDFPTTAGVFQTKLGGVAATNVFVTKLKPDGTGLLYSTYLGGTREDEVRGIAVNSAGNPFLPGNAASTDFPTTTGAFATKNTGKSDVFVTKLDPNGAKLVYSTYIGGGSSDTAEAIAIDSSGDAFLTGL